MLLFCSYKRTAPYLFMQSCLDETEINPADNWALLHALTGRRTWWWLSWLQRWSFHRKCGVGRRPRARSWLRLRRCYRWCLERRFRWFFSSGEGVCCRTCWGSYRTFWCQVLIFYRLCSLSTNWWKLIDLVDTVYESSLWCRLRIDTACMRLSGQIRNARSRSSTAFLLAPSATLCAPPFGNDSARQWPAIPASFLTSYRIAGMGTPRRSCTDWA